MPKELVQIGGPRLSAVRKARLALKERALEILEGYILVIKQAAAQGDFESAIKGYQHLMDHMPEEEGEKLLDISVDKPKQIEQRYGGPQIQIGLAIGGVPQPVIEVRPQTTIEGEVVEKG